MQEPESSSSGRCPECFVIVHNVAKKHNIGTLARSCTAFNVAQMCLVGSRHYNTFGSHGSAAHVPLAYFVTLDECCAWLHTHKGCEIIGVEITDAAHAVNTHPFRGNTAFMLGNEGTGLSEHQLKLCDSFVYIPQHGQGTASLNVTVAASIILHHFAVWAGYQECSRHGAKYDVAPPPQRTAARGQVPLSSQEAAALKALRQSSASQDWLMESESGSPSNAADTEQPATGLLGDIFEG
ncbi:hypothetical protein ABBQ38_007053 [Trebouxia sp. C0009 RCD-2024]